MLRCIVPHLHIDYSANLEAVIDMAGLCEVLRVAATQIEAFPLAGIRVRATRAEHYAIADGNPRHGFIDLSVRLRAGRPQSVKEAAIAHVFAALEAFVEPVLASQSIALSAEMRDIDPSLAPKSGNIRQHLAGAS